jgi:CMP-2-keto-3-deoxyoctulosonic acid synthetase
MNDRIPTKVEIFNAVDAQGKTIQALSERILKIENLTDKQEDRNRTIIIAVLIAVVLIVAGAAIQVFFTEKDDRERTDRLLETVQKAQMDTFTTETDLQTLKVRNPYLK